MAFNVVTGSGLCAARNSTLEYFARPNATGAVCARTAADRSRVRNVGTGGKPGTRRKRFSSPQIRNGLLIDDRKLPNQGRMPPVREFT